MSEPLSQADLAARIETLLQANDFGLATWTTSSAPPLVFTYKFETAAAADFPFGGISGLVAYTEAQKTAVRAALAEYESIFNVRFQESPAATDPDFSFYTAGNLGSAGGIGAWAFSGSNWDGSVIFRSDIDLAANFDLVLHEIGHSLGLKHPGNYDVGGGGAPGPYLPEAEDNDKFTVMSYNTNPTSGLTSRHLMVYDIAALQTFWGSNLTTRTGNDLYTGPDDGIIQTIWDAGGIDTLQYTGAVAANLDLRAGTFSSLGAADNLSIAYGVTIENATGGSGNDTLRGNSAANVLDGGAGSDTLRGGTGNDTYFVENAADIVFEATGQGTDIVRATISKALFANVETLILDGTANLNGAGNDLANTLIGNAGANVLDGRLGADRMFGHGGNDTYLVDNAADLVGESAGNGTDTVKSVISYALGSNVEKLLLLGTANINGTGNGLANVIVGNNGSNRLDGGAGIDNLTGGLGLDYLTGSAGNDRFIFNSTSDSTFSAADRILDFGVGDQIWLSGIDANTLLANDQAFALDLDGSFSAGEIRQTLVGANLLLEMNVNATASAEMAILLLGRGSLLTGGDLVA
ncbi:MAG: M10 family metallopeptidase C-terminal domain-containing protein [Hyphomicrobiaceae bacterium]|nr:M10 family metallopeptidase C-terminal domain-containing protein [Hyphomicrobiaceae bacterium]